MAEIHISNKTTNRSLSVVQSFINQVLSIINMNNIAYFFAWQANTLLSGSSLSNTSSTFLFIQLANNIK